MAKLSSIIREVLYEEKEKTLKIFYSNDIFIQEFPDEKEPEEVPEKEPTSQEPVGQEPVGQEQQPAPAESTQEKEKLLTEEIFKSKGEGEVSVPKDKAKAILTLNDLLEFLEDQKNDGGGQIINELVVEIIKSLSGEDTQKAVQDLLNKGDKCNITIDYGFDKEDSIGLQVSKNPGVNLATIIMRKDSSPITGQFNLQIFNQTITGVFLKEIQ